MIYKTILVSLIHWHYSFDWLTIKTQLRSLGLQMASRFYYNIFNL